jgi:hypothetical protein
MAVVLKKPHTPNSTTTTTNSGTTHRRARPHPFLFGSQLLQPNVLYKQGSPLAVPENSSSLAPTKISTAAPGDVCGCVSGQPNSRRGRQTCATWGFKAWKSNQILCEQEHKRNSGVDVFSGWNAANHGGYGCRYDLEGSGLDRSTLHPTVR